MARTPATFKQTDVLRAVKAVQAAAEKVACVEVAPDGTIRILISNCSPVPTSALEEWKQRHASSA